MAFTEHLRQQHVEIMRLATRLGELVAESGDNAGDARSLVSRLVSELLPHLALEDRILYPRLAAHHDRQVRDIAGRFIAEMSGLRAEIEHFDAGWTASEIGARPAEFRAAAQAILAALGQRIRNENAALYPVADAAVLTLRVGAAP